MNDPTNMSDKPVGNLAGFKKYFKQDFISGLLVFLIALPLCLGISVASGFPPIAGIFTAIIGSILTTFISNSELTIKGPAAGMIIIVLGCVETFGGVGNMDAYRAALAVGVVAAVLQILFGIFRAGIFSEFFPLSAVHGMLAAIGVIIMLKQFPFLLGLKESAKPLEMLQQIPTYLSNANLAIALIGGTSLLIMFLWPLVGKKVAILKRIPSPIIVLLVAIPMGMQLNLLETHNVQLMGGQYEVGEHHLVDMPKKAFGMFKEITFPDFAVLQRPIAWYWVMMFFIIGSLESLLSAKAVDLLDPWKRKTDMNHDVIAVGIGNLCASMIGGLPMISEIVRSKANIDNGARTRFADLWHGMFLLLCVALIPFYLHLIPLAALAAMLIYTGFRLAHPTEFLHVYRIGREQLLIFVVTLVAVLATDLLIGIAIGIVLKMVIHLVNGATPATLFKPTLDIQAEPGEDNARVVVSESLVFSNWLGLRKQLQRLGIGENRNVVLDVSAAKLIDHSTVEKLDEIESDFEDAGKTLTIEGLDQLEPFTDDPHSARKQRPAT